MNRLYFLKHKYAPHLANAGLFVLTLILHFNISFSENDWNRLTDPTDYLHQSKISLLDKEFYLPQKADNFDPRPFTVPLFYKMCHSDTNAIVRMQMFMVSFSAFFLVMAFITLMDKNSAKYLLMLGVYLLVSWWNVLGWSTLVLSESLSASLLFCWLASLLFLYKKKTFNWVLLHAAITVLFAFTRDSWPYVLITFYGGMCLLLLVLKQRDVKNYAAMLVLSLGIFFFQQHAAHIGQRHKLPVINSIVVRILHNQDYTAWFVKNGMPCAEKLQQNFASLDVVPEEGQHKLWALYGDTAYQPFLTWVEEKGQSTYTRFLITHPSFTLGSEETPLQLHRIMCYNLFYIDVPRGYSAYVQNLFPLFGAGVVVVLCIMLVMIYTQRRRPVLFGPVLLVLFTLMNVILSYNADALEVERHLFITNILVQLTGFWAVALIWDALKWRIKLHSPDKA